MPSPVGTSVVVTGRCLAYPPAALIDPGRLPTHINGRHSQPARYLGSHAGRYCIRDGGTQHDGLATRSFKTSGIVIYTVEYSTKETHDGKHADQG